jgi:hypothetical protein
MAIEVPLFNDPRHSKSHFGRKNVAFLSDHQIQTQSSAVAKLAAFTVHLVCIVEERSQIGHATGNASVQHVTVGQ